MKLSTKTFLVVFITVFIFIFLLSFVIKPYLLQDPIILDETNTIMDVERVHKDIQLDMDGLARTNRDWAVWDDTFYFLRGGMPDYISKNLTSQTFENNLIDFIVFYNHKNELVFHRGYDSKSHQIMPLDLEFTKAFYSVVASDKSINRSLLIATKNGAVMTAFHSVYDSNGEGPRAGTLIMGRMIDKDYINELGTRLSLKLTWKQGEYQEHASLKNVNLMDEETLIGRLSLQDYTEHVTYHIFFESPREFYQQRMENIRYLSVYLLLASMLLMLIIHILVNKLVISRIYELLMQLNTIQGQKDVKARIRLNKRYRDEISTLETSVNHMLSSLEEKHNEIERMAYYDQLTLLPNRYLLEKHYLKLCQNHDQIGLLFFDLDGFKTVNDLYGHKIGDLLLQSVSSRLAWLQEIDGFLSRYGGDEFVVLLPYKHKTELIEVANRIIVSTSEELTIHSHTVSVTASIGISISTSDSNKLDGLLKKADLAMYIAKSKGKNQTIFYDDIK